MKAKVDSGVHIFSHIILKYVKRIVVPRKISLNDQLIKTEQVKLYYCIHHIEVLHCQTKVPGNHNKFFQCPPPPLTLYISSSTPRNFSNSSIKIHYYPTTKPPDNRLVATNTVTTR